MSDMTGHEQVCLSCTEPAENCGKFRYACAYKKKYPQKRPPAYLKQDSCGFGERDERYGHEAIYRAAMRMERAMGIGGV